MPPALFPSNTLNEAIELAKVIATTNSGQPMYRVDIFAALKRAPDSGPSRSLVTSSGQYDLTSGSYKSDQLSLTPLGKKIVVDGDARAMVDAVLKVPIFKRFFDKYSGAAMPAEIPARSFLGDSGIPAERTEACWKVLVESGRQCGLIQTIGQSERVVPPDRAVQPIGAPSSSAQALDASHRQPTTTQDGTSSEEPEKPPRIPQPRMPSVQFNIELHLPGDATAETYDAIFSSLRRHLIDVGE